MPEFRTAEEVERAKWAEKYVSVADGKLYCEEESPFPVHAYLKNKLLGKTVQMLELNAGAAIIDQLVADTVTDLIIQVGEDGTDKNEATIREWLESIEYINILEESAKHLFGVGYCVQQPIRDVAANGKENTYAVTNIDPSTWYPDIPLFAHQDPISGSVINVFSEEVSGSDVWYAFVEEHEIGKVRYKLYQLENADATEGKEAKLSDLSQFDEIKKDEVVTGLDYLAIFQKNRRKSSTLFYGQSILANVWGMLQEVSEIQTQIRQERIKHLRAKMYGPERSFQKVTQDMGGIENSKLMAIREEVNRAIFDLNQEIFPVPAGSTIVPGYIQRDLQSIVIGSAEIDKLLSRIASIVGAPRSIFNLDERGTVHVETEKRKDRRYVKHVVQAQRKLAMLAWDTIQTWWRWNHGGKPLDNLTVTLRDPFELTMEERVSLMKDMNPSATLVSEKRAIKEVWKDLAPEDREELEKEIADEHTAAQANSELGNPVELDF